jgi:Zn-dependent peptidase ImmA (M78 family)
VVVLGTEKNDRARSRFDTSHELGHLVMHGQEIYGLKEIEQQANWFAAEFLMPAADIRDELPCRVDWPRLFELKQRWQVSLAALLMRARTLGTLTETQYLTAIKTASARGWRRREPIPLGEPERPTLLAAAVGHATDGSIRDALPQTVLRALENAA